MPFASLLLAADSATTVPLTAALDNPVGQMYPMIATVVVFLIVFGILATVVWPKILGGLEDRQQKIQGDIEQAEQSRAEAEQAKADFEAKLAEARKEAAETIAQAKADAQKVADELRAANDADSPNFAPRPWLTSNRPSLRPWLKSTPRRVLWPPRWRARFWGVKSPWPTSSNWCKKALRK